MYHVNKKQVVRRDYRGSTQVVLSFPIVCIVFLSVSASLRLWLAMSPLLLCRLLSSASSSSSAAFSSLLISPLPSYPPSPFLLPFAFFRLLDLLVCRFLPILDPIWDFIFHQSNGRGLNQLLQLSYPTATHLLHSSFF